MSKRKILEKMEALERRVFELETELRVWNRAGRCRIPANIVRQLTAKELKFHMMDLTDVPEPEPENDLGFEDL